MPFATTKHLNIRAWRDSDKAHVIAIESDQRVSRLGYPGYTVPMAPQGFQGMWDNFLSKTLMLIVVEAKKQYVGMRKWDEGEKRVADGLEKKDEDWDKELFVGYAALSMSIPKNRAASFGIALMPQWWGHGFGTEVTEWVVQHGFEQLALHRITLGTYGHNLRAQKVYKKCGFVLEGTTRKAWWTDGRWEDEVLMGILDEEYWARKKQLAAHST